MKGFARQRSFAALFALLVALMALALAAPARADHHALNVELRDLSGRVAGNAMMTEMEDGTIEITVKVAGMNPVAGDHLFGVTEVGSCAPDFDAAGDLVATFPHVQFYRNGSADYKVWVEGTLDELRDGDGSAVVLHADTDDESDRILCGVAVMPGTAPMPPAPPAAPAPPAPQPTTPPAPAPAPEPEPGEERSFIEYLEDGAGLFLYDANGRIVGLSLMFTDDFGFTDLSIIVEDMQPVPGNHMIAITESGQCDTPDFASAGDDLYVFEQPVQMFASGAIDFAGWVPSEELDVRDLFDGDGSALVIYADDHDNPGARIVCGAALPFRDFVESLGLTLEDFVAIFFE